MTTNSPPYAERDIENAPRRQAEEFSLVDAYVEAFQLIHMLRLGVAPTDREILHSQVKSLIDSSRKRALKAGIEPQSVDDASYAVCATIDESVLASTSAFKESWESHPLQLSIFGDQLAGEHFFDRLDRLRERGRAQLAVIEVFHMCLTLGFRGRYHLDDADRLRYLVTRLAEDIAQGHKGSGPLAPHWARPDVRVLGLRRMASAVVVLGLLATAGIAGGFMLDRTLDTESARSAKAVDGLVELPARVARLSITLP